MNIGKEIVNLYSLPLYQDPNEFLDKVFSYLYARFKYKQVKLLNEKELSIEKDLFIDTPIIVKEKNSETFCRLSKKNIEDVSNIKELYIKISLPEETDKYLFIKLEKKPKQFKTVSDLREFLVFLREYFTKYYSSQKVLTVKEPVEEIKNHIKIKDTTIDSGVDIKQFYSVNANKMPDEVDLVHVLDKIEKSMIREMLKRVSGKKSIAAKKLNITERMIGYKINKYHL